MAFDKTMTSFWIRYNAPMVNIAVGGNVLFIPTGHSVCNSSVTLIEIQCESTPPLRFSEIFSQTVGNFSINFYPRAGNSDCNVSARPSRAGIVSKRRKLAA